MDATNSIVPIQSIAHYLFCLYHCQEINITSRNSYRGKF